MQRLLLATLGFFALALVGSSTYHSTPTTPVVDVPAHVIATSTSVEEPVAGTSANNAAQVVATATQEPAPTRTPSTPSIRTKTSGCVADQALPDRACSPGDVLTTDASVVCVTGYTATVRDVPDSLKKQVFAEYGIPWSEHGNYEVDHIISLELGGSNDISNLYPESYLIQYNAHVKDGFENHLRSLVCKGELPLTVAQEEIATDWVKYYLEWKGSAPAPVTTTSQSSPTPTVSTQPSTQTSTTDPQYYTSSYGSAQYYYPASCSAWKSLSPKYLEGFQTLDELRAKYNRILSPQC